MLINKLLDKLLYRTNYLTVRTVRKFDNPVKEIMEVAMDFDGLVRFDVSDDRSTSISIYERGETIKTLRIKLWYRKLRSLICH